MLMGESYEIRAQLTITKVHQYSDGRWTEVMEAIDATTTVYTLGEATKTTADFLKLLRRAGRESYSVITVNSE
jgi:hypothetical protein